MSPSRKVESGRSRGQRTAGLAGAARCLFLALLLAACVARASAAQPQAMQPMDMSMDMGMGMDAGMGADLGAASDGALGLSDPLSGSDPLSLSGALPSLSNPAPALSMPVPVPPPVAGQPYLLPDGRVSIGGHNLLASNVAGDGRTLLVNGTNVQLNLAQGQQMVLVNARVVVLSSMPPSFVTRVINGRTVRQRLPPSWMEKTLQAGAVPPAMPEVQREPAVPGRNIVLWKGRAWLSPDVANFLPPPGDAPRQTVGVFKLVLAENGRDVALVRTNVRKPNLNRFKPRPMAAAAANAAAPAAATGAEPAAAAAAAPGAAPVGRQARKLHPAQVKAARAKRMRALRERKARARAARAKRRWPAGRSLDKPPQGSFGWTGVFPNGTDAVEQDGELLSVAHPILEQPAPVVAAGPGAALPLGLDASKMDGQDVGVDMPSVGPVQAPAQLPAGDEAAMAAFLEQEALEAEAEAEEAEETALLQMAESSEEAAESSLTPYQLALIRAANDRYMGPLKPLPPAPAPLPAPRSERAHLLPDGRLAVNHTVFRVARVLDDGLRAVVNGTILRLPIRSDRRAVLIRGRLFVMRPLPVEHVTRVLDGKLQRVPIPAGWRVRNDTLVPAPVQPGTSVVMYDGKAWAMPLVPGWTASKRLKGPQPVTVATPTAKIPTLPPLRPNASKWEKKRWHAVQDLLLKQQALNRDTHRVMHPVLPQLERNDDGSFRVTAGQLMGLAPPMAALEDELEDQLAAQRQINPTPPGVTVTPPPDVKLFPNATAVKATTSVLPTVAVPVAPAASKKASKAAKRAAKFASPEDTAALKDAIRKQARKDAREPGANKLQVHREKKAALRALDKQAEAAAVAGGVKSVSAGAPAKQSLLSVGEGVFVTQPLQKLKQKLEVVINDEW